MNEAQRISDEGTLALYDEEEADEGEGDVEIDVGSDVEEVAGGREVLPSDLPPAPTPSEFPEAVSTREVVPSELPPPAAEVPLLMPVSRPPAAAEKAVTPSVAPAAAAQTPPTPRTRSDAKGRQGGQPSNIDMLDALVSEGQWKKVCGLLARYGKRGKLPARLALIYAIALNEVRVPGAAIDKQATDIERFAQESLAALLQTDAKSPLVRMVVKRVLRRSWRSAPAPPTRTSVLLIIAAIMLGAFIGFLMGPGKDWFKHM